MYALPEKDFYGFHYQTLIATLTVWSQVKWISRFL